MAASFSVAMCTYNGAAFVSAQLESIAAQTRRPDELMVCDDRSTDETVRLVERFAARVPFPVRVEVNERNLGSTQNFGKAIGLCRGDLIALADQDDAWMPSKLERMEEVFAARSGIGLVFTDAELVDENLRPLGKRLWSVIKFDGEKQRMVREGHAFDLISRYNVVTGATMAFRSKYKELFLPIPALEGYIHDGWIALTVSAVAPLSCIPEPLILYRQHAAQQMSIDWQFAESGSDGGEGWLEAATRVRPLGREISKYRAVYERLEARRDRFDSRAWMARFGPKLAHLEARAAMRGGRLGRVPRVLKELAALRYHRYSQGLRSAAKDLWLGNHE